MKNIAIIAGLWPRLRSRVRPMPAVPSGHVGHHGRNHREGAIQTCKAQGYNVSAHVPAAAAGARCDARRRCPLEAYENSAKAWTSRAQRTPSLNFANAVKANLTVGAIHLSTWCRYSASIMADKRHRQYGQVSGARRRQTKHAPSRIDKVAQLSPIVMLKTTARGLSRAVVV
jgi:hypothetical protein